MNPITKDAEAQRLYLEIISPAELERIHELSLTILENTGLIVHYPPARELLRRRGATVDEPRELVRIPRRLVEEALGSTPKEVIMRGQAAPERDCVLGVHGGHYTRPSTGLNWIIDYRAPERRPVMKEDVINWARLADGLPNIHFVGSLYDQEGSSKSMEARCVARLLHYTDKPLMFSALSGEGMRWLHRLTEIAQPAGRQPRAMVLSSVNSPLIYGWGQCEAAMVSAEVGIPVLFNSSAVAGVTGPTTLAGNIALINAEMLGALTIIQHHRPGAYAIYAAHPMVMDMKSGMASISVGEVGMMSAACIQLGRRYGLPTSSNGITTDSCSPDPLAVVEKWASGFLPAMAGANINAGAGSLSCVGTVSLEQLAIDDDIYGHMFRQIRGISVNDDTLAGELIARVGAGGAFLLEEHTLQHFRTEYYYSPLANRLSAQTWEAEGSIDALGKAHARVEAILSRPAAPLLSEAQSQEIWQVLAQAEEALAEIDVPI